MPARKTKIGIACQGGGSQTAFTAGALKALLEEGVHEKFDIVSMSGTSGGAICATLAWYALMKKDAEPWRRLIDFWHENTAQTRAEQVFNHYVVHGLRSVSRGHVAQFQMSPASPLMKSMVGVATRGLRPRFVDLRLLLEAHIDFAELKSWGPIKTRPVLIVGAVNISDGHLAKFNSRKGHIRLEHILASCAVPNIFPAVELNGEAYWDGLFSDNPPVGEMIRAPIVGLENLPNEIWVIKINPTGQVRIPTAPAEIADRRNELIGNISLFQQIAALSFINELMLEDALRPEFLRRFDVEKPIRIPRCYMDDEMRPYHIPFIEISVPLHEKLDYESKLDRSPEHIRELIADGEKQARAFLAERGD